MVNKNIICLEYQNNIPLLVKKKNIKVEPLNIVNKFKEKYTKKELILLQENILSNLNKRIREVKEVLVYLSNNTLDINVDDYLFYDKFINDVMVACEDFDKYCTDIAENLSKEFMLLHINSLTKLNNLIIPNHKKIMYTYLEKSYSFISKIENRNIGFIHVDQPMDNFLEVFKVLLKIKKMFITFFNTLIIGTDIGTADTVLIDNFFSQYELMAFLDFYEHTSERNLSKFITEKGINEYHKNFPLYVSDKCKEAMSSIFTDGTQYMFNSIKLIPFILCLKTTHKKIIEKKHIHNFIREHYKNCLFILNDSTDNTYSHFYDDCIIDFNYVSKMINGLEYIYYIDNSLITNL